MLPSRRGRQTAHSARDGLRTETLVVGSAMISGRISRSHDDVNLIGALPSPSTKRCLRLLDWHPTTGLQPKQTEA